MSRIFNISADCKPNLHYMVDINGLLLKIKEYIDRGDYFTMNLFTLVLMLTLSLNR